MQNLGWRSSVQLRFICTSCLICLPLNLDIQAVPDVPPAMADAVNRGGEFLASLTAGTPWETVAKEVSNTIGMDSGIVRAEISKDIEVLVNVIVSWLKANTSARLLRP